MRAMIRRPLPIALFVSAWLAACESAREAPSARPAAAATASSAAIARAPEVSPAERLAADVAWLAADAQEGRRAGTEAGARAGRWLAEKLAALGLAAAGDAGSYLQEFTVPLPVEVGDGSAVVVSGEELRGSESVMPLFCSASGEASGELEWRGYGIVSGENGWNDYATRCDGKVVLIVRGTPPEPPQKEEAPAEAAAENPHGGNVQSTSAWGNAGSLFLKVMNAKRNGAVAVIVAQHPSQKGEPLPPFDYSRAGRGEIPAVLVSWDVAVGLSPSFEASVEAFDSGRAPEVYAGALVGKSVTVRADVRRSKGPAQNVLARVPGERSDRCVVIGAHYDHLGLGGEGSLAPSAHGEVHNGADDNASGTAVVLEVARILASGPKPPCDVVLALWSGEELGLLGSEHWGQHPTVPIESVVANVNLDMVGRAGSGKLAVLGAGSAEPLEGWLRDIAADVGLELDISRSGQGVGGSDHQTFLKRKIPAVHFFSGVHADYHKPTDDADKFESAGAAKVAALTAELARRLARAPALAWTEPPAPEGGQRQGGPFRVWFGSVPEYSYEGKGLKLAGTSAGSPAEKAGLIAGDVVVQVGDVQVDSINDFMYALQTYKPGDVVLTRYVRDGEEQTVRITLTTRDAQ
jgi:hypothetical protein